MMTSCTLPNLKTESCSGLINFCCMLQAGENNARVQAAAVETLLALAQQKEAGLSALASLFLKPEKATQWKRVLGR